MRDAFFLVAQTAESSEGLDWVSLVAQGGPWAVVVILILIGKLVPERAHDRVIQENVELKQKLAHMEDLIENQVIPAMVRYADGLSRRADPGTGR